MTTRGLIETDMVKIADFLHRGVQLALKIQKSLPADDLKLNSFLMALDQSGEFQKELNIIKSDVYEFAKSFPYPGIHV